MTSRKVFSPIKYKKTSPKKAEIIIRAVKRGVKDYGETFRKLASA